MGRLFVFFALSSCLIVADKAPLQQGDALLFLVSGFGPREAGQKNQRRLDRVVTVVARRPRNNWQSLRQGR
jgi:hypothetical protein